METKPGSSPAARLDSWKAIANYLGKTVRTVQRWEKDAGLPVRRIDPDSGASVYAYQHELDRWLTRKNLTVLDAGTAPAVVDPSPEPAPHSDGHHSSQPSTHGQPPTRRIAWAWPGAVVLAAAAAWILGQWNHNGASDDLVDDAHTAQPRLLTTDPGDERFPALSPDGRQVAYVWTNPEGQVDIYSRVVDINVPQRLTDDDAVEEGVAWSPDGLNLAYLKRSGPTTRELRVMSAVGTDDRLLHEFTVSYYFDEDRTKTASLDWSPDGAWIVFSEGQYDLHGTRLSLIRLSDFEVVPLTPFQGGAIDHNPAFSPNGNRIAFTRSPRATMGSIVVLDLEHDPVRGVGETTMPSPNQWNSNAEWSMDGQDLIFSGGLWPRSRLWRVAADGQSDPRLMTNIDIGASQPSVSSIHFPGMPEGSWRMVYRLMELENDIWRVDLEGSQPDQRLIASSQRERFPSWSESGRIAFLSDRNGHREIYALGDDGVAWVQWTDWQSNYVRTPQFSPDGQTLAYIVANEGQFGLRLQSGPLGPSRSLHQPGYRDIGLAWANDGLRVYIHSRSEDEQDVGVWSVNLDSGQREKLIDGAFVPVMDDPDTRQLYLASRKGESVQLFALDLGDGSFARVDLGAGQQHSFTGAGRAIYFIEQGAGAHHLMRWSPEANEKTPMLTMDYTPETGLAISPDGTEALITRINQQSSDLMMADFGVTEISP